jgi:cytosine/adenosine deaminase-related metal-dependent hydrolase
MSSMTRKDFLRLASVTAAAGALGGRSAAAAQQTVGQGAASRSGSAGPMVMRGADVLTMDPLQLEMYGTDVRVENGKIVALGKNLPTQGAEIIEAQGMILMPGMVDGHRHVWEILDLGRVVGSNPAQFNKYQEWKMRTIVCMSAEDNYLGGLVGGLQAINSGVTTVFDYAHAQHNEAKAIAAAQGLKDSGIAGTFAFQLGVSSSYGPGQSVPMAQAVEERVAPSTEVHWRTATRLQKEIFSDSSALLQFGLAPSEYTASTIADIKKEWARCRGMGVGLLALHLHKPSKTYPAGVMGHRDSGIADLHEAGLLGPDLHFSHGNELTNDELKMLHDSGGLLCATPMSEFAYVSNPNGGPSCHWRAREAGVATGVGVDVSLAVPLDYFEHIRSAFSSLYTDPEPRNNETKYKSADTLDFATRMGAKALRIGEITGSISVGKRADLVLLSTERIDFAMAGTLADRVLNFASTSDIDSVWIAGKARKRGGKMLGVDWRGLKTQLIEAQQRIGREAATIKFT